MDAQKKKLITLGCLIIVFVILAICVWPKPKEEDNKNELEKRTIANTYTMYVRINPLVKLVYKETYEMCKKENGFEYACSSRESVVNNFELLNDDARKFYQDLDFKGKDLLSVLVDICDIARDNKVGFSSFEIISDNLELDTADLKEKLKDNSRYETEYEIYVQFEEFLNEKEIIENNITKYKVIFETGLNNGTDQTILVKENESVNEPISLLRDGYTFVEWQNNGQKFDFTTPITKDTVLKAVWKKDKTTTTTKTSKETTVKTTISDKTTKETTTKKVSNITSTVDKINLNENILVSKDHYRLGGDCGNYEYYIFANNVSNVFGYISSGNNKYVLYNAYDEKKCNLDDEEEASKCYDDQCKKITSEFIELSKNINYDSVLENETKGLLDAFKNNKIKGLKSFNYSVDNHQFSYYYEYLYLQNAKSLDEFGEAYNDMLRDNQKLIDNLFVKGNFIDKYCVGGCGSGPGEAIILNESLCEEYNLNCSRW